MEEKNKDNLDRLSIKVSQLFLISFSLFNWISEELNLIWLDE